MNWALADQAVVSAANFLTALIVARFLGLEAFGIFSITWLALLFTHSFQIALILTPMLSIGPKTEEDEVAGYYASAQLLQIGFALFSGFLTAGVLVLAGPLMGIGELGFRLALPLALVVATTQMHEFYRRHCFARSLPFKALQIDLVRYGIQLTVMLYLFNQGLGSVENALLIISASAALGLVMLVRGFPTLAWQRTRVIATLIHHWNMSKWLAPSAFMQWTSGNFFVLAAGAMLGPTAVGAMRAAQNLMGVTHVFFQALDNWAPVQAARIHTEQGMHGLCRFTRRLILCMGCVTAFIVLGLVLPAKLWLTLFYGEDYTSYGWLVAWYGLSYVLMATHTPYRYSFIAIENTKPMFLGYVLATIFSIAAVYPLIAFGGLQGAMIGIVTTQACLCLSLVLLGQKYLYSTQSSRETNTKGLL